MHINVAACDAVCSEHFRRVEGRQFFFVHDWQGMQKNGLAEAVDVFDEFRPSCDELHDYRQGANY